MDEAFIAAMHKNAGERASAVVRAAAPAEPRRMLDVGGGSGAYAIAFAQAHPQLHVDILDATVTPMPNGTSRPRTSRTACARATAT